MHSRMFLPSLLGSAAQVLGAPVLPVPPTTTSDVVTATTTTGACSQYFAPGDHGNCYGRHCGPQNFAPFETPTHCAGEAHSPEKRHNVCRHVNGTLHCPKQVKVTKMAHHVTRAINNEAASTAVIPTLIDVVINKTSADMNETVSDMIEFLAKHEKVAKVSDSAATTSHKMDTTTTVTVTQTPTATIDNVQELEKRRNLCRIVDGKVHCGKNLSHYLAESTHTPAKHNMTVKPTHTKHHGGKPSTITNCTATISTAAVETDLLDELLDMNKHCRFMDGKHHCQKNATLHTSHSNVTHVETAVEAVETVIDALASAFLPAHRQPIKRVVYDGEGVDENDPPAQTDDNSKHDDILASDAPNVWPAKVAVTSFNVNEGLPTGENLRIEEARHCKIRCDHDAAEGDACYHDCMAEFRPAELYEPVFYEEVQADGKIVERRDAKNHTVTPTAKNVVPEELVAVMAAGADKPIPTGGDRYIEEAKYCKVKCDHDIAFGDADATCYKDCVLDFDPARLHEPMYYEPAHIAFQIERRNELAQNAENDKTMVDADEPQTVVIDMKEPVYVFDPASPIPTGGDLYIAIAQYCKVKCDHEIAAGTSVPSLCYQDCTTEFNPTDLHLPVYDGALDNAGAKPDVFSTGP